MLVQGFTLNIVKLLSHGNKFMEFYYFHSPINTMLKSVFDKKNTVFIPSKLFAYTFTYLMTKSTSDNFDLYEKF